MRIGFKLMSEEHDPRALVEQAVQAEAHGFAFAAISDHFSPWLDEEGHSPFAWSVLGAIAQATHQLGLATAVTCPSWRYHPAIVAQAAATTALLSGREFWLGLGSGERLNEHVIDAGWPSVAVRQQRLAEAVEIIRRLFSGETCTYRGEHLRLSDARLFDRPKTPLRILLAAGGPQAAKLAAENADGLIASESKHALTEAYRKAGGQGPRLVELGVCWGKSERAAREVIHRYARWSTLGWHVLPELPNPRSFAAASEGVTPEQAAREVPHGPEVGRFTKAIHEAQSAGFDNVVLHQIGPDQAGFMRFFQDELMPALE
jgi:G6PDH family F420-dependent oxidoreductase